MLRSFFIYLSKAAWAKRMVTGWSFAWRMASRFIAGEKVEHAIQAVKELNAKGINVSLDHLGEHTSNPEEAKSATKDVLNLIDAIDQAGVRANVSVKLSQIGMTLDENLCVQNLSTILDSARQRSIFVRLDMEDSPWVDMTLKIYHTMCKDLGFDNVGLVIQAYLFRSQDDLTQLEKSATRIRLCKGAYMEPPSVAFPKKADVDANYDRLAAMLMESEKNNGTPLLAEDGKTPPIPAIASHDEKRIQFAKEYADEIGLPKQAIEFQMLYGIRRDLQDKLVAEGYPVRVYVPYGTQWYPYFMRRLAERPANVWFFISNFFKG